ncbi:hypothetical protein F5Y16DRAFT_395486 [Xylariaceae sp. FL0255]|nr:hypothetical protein F5Y16DRAFT_395486 [Xylariaceae sp. FL0255]
MRNPGSGIATEGEPKQFEAGSPRTSALVSTNTSLNALQGEKTRSLARPGPNQASTAPTHQRRQTNLSSAFRNSILSDATTSDSPSRKKSSLRNAFGKIFGRKKKGSRSTSDSEILTAPSDDPKINPRDQPVAEGEPKRSASLPITEFNRALRSHSIGPDDFIAIHSARTSLQADPTFMRKRATTTSDFSFGRHKDEDVEGFGLSPRPASAQAHDLIDNPDPDTIGRAVSGDMMTFRRRSRSLSQLPDTGEGQGLVRNRSQEIRFWRESYDPGALSPDLSTSNDNEKSPGPSETAMGELLPSTPPQPFNFGPLVSMKITEAASLEDRMTRLEGHNQKLEKLVSQLVQAVPGCSHLLNALDSSLEPVQEVPSSSAAGSSMFAGMPQEPAPQPSGYSQTNESFEDSQTFVGSIHPSTTVAPRPISNVTIRGATSLPSLPRVSSGDLRAQIEAERAAREALEHQVAKLTQMVDILSRTTQQTPNTSVQPTQVSVFEHDDDEDEAEGEYEGEEPLSASVDDDDAFKTPREEYAPAHGFGAFGEELHDEADDGRKKAARTLSLSQLTLGKPPKKQTRKADPGVDL